MTLRYSIAPEADRDLEDIRDGIAQDSPAAAKRLLNQFYDHFDQIGDCPKIGPARDEIRPGLRSVPVGKYVIFYRLAPAGPEIVRIVWGGRDLERLFDR